jgi:rSAM/selenodomain-associated transferase 2
MSEANRGISIVVPVLGEAERINALVDGLLALPAPGPLEIVVVDGDPAGDTINSLSRKEVITLTASGGRAGQMNAGAAEASQGILLFLHADTALPPGGPAEVARSVRELGYRAGAFDLDLVSDRPLVRLISAAGRLRSRLTRVPFGDQAQFFERDYFRELGGFKDMPLMEDVEIMRRIRRRGDEIRILELRARTSARRYEQQGPLRRMLGNWTIQLLYLLGRPPEKLARRYRERSGK